MAQYLVLIYGDEAAWAAGGAEINERAMKAHMKFGDCLLYTSRCV